MEVENYRHESDDTSELFDDFAALPDQFRPKKTFKNDLKQPATIPKIPIQKESSFNSSGSRSLSKTTDESPGISKSVVKNEGKINPQNRLTSVPPKEVTRLHIKDGVSKKDKTVERNPFQKGLSLSKRLSEMSVETEHFPEDIKNKKKVWNNDLVIQTEPQVWKFNGSTLEPKKTCSQLTMTAKRTTVSKVKKENNILHGERNAPSKASSLKKKNNCGWNDNMDLFIDNKMNFGYISKETKNGSSTITACWGDVHQTRPLVGPSKQNFAARQWANKPPRPKKTPQPKHEDDLKRSSVGNETGKPIVDRPKRRHRSNNKVKTTIIRHEIKVIHVNAKDGETNSVKETSPEKSDNVMSLENLVLSGCQDRLFAFGTKAGLEESQLFQSGLAFSRSKTKEGTPSDLEKISVRSDTPPSKGSEASFHCDQTPKGCRAPLGDSKIERRSSFLRFGRDISEVVAGCHVARSMLVALHEKWIPVRNKTIELMERLAENVSSSKRKNRKIQKAVDLIQNGSNVICAVPNIKVTIVARIIAAITPFISMLFKSSPNITQTGVTETEMMNQIQDDIEATLEVYMYGTQCDHQFREVCELFEKFQNFIDSADLSDFTGPEADFIRDISFFSSKNLVVYYGRLNKALLNLIANQNSDISRTFCRGFEDNPQAVATVQHLHWRFPAQIEDCEAFQRAWKEVSRVLESSDTNTEVLEEIRDCINILRKERRTIENNVAELRKDIE